ncbi:hypothetical protein AX15_002878 [Amanita polypyramis BW_CC]|nr:hypothetical protein AX15_002878 [Amanita polypyramis BW_CC]
MPVIESIRGLLASAGSSATGPTSTSLDKTLERIINTHYAPSWPDVAFAAIMKCKDGTALLRALQIDYRIRKVVHYKMEPKKYLGNIVEHEFVVVHLHYKGKNTTVRTDRVIGPGFAGNDEDLINPDRVVDYCTCQFSNISSPQRWTRGTVIQISKTPDRSHALTTVDFTRCTSVCPSLWDLVHLLHFANDECDKNTDIDAQCYWYADVVSGILENWCQDATITHHYGWQGTKSKVLSIAAPGMCKGVAIHKRDPELIAQKKIALMGFIENSTRTAERFLSLSRSG